MISYMQVGLENDVKCPCRRGEKAERLACRGFVGLLLGFLDNWVDFGVPMLGLGTGSVVVGLRPVELG